MTVRITDDWLKDAGAQRLCSMLLEAGFQAYFVGGCVRNALLGAPISDIDLTTDATPETVVALADAAGFDPVPTGIEHGTVTVVVDGHPFEVTTFRHDVETDGRRAVVSFAHSIEEDARRRDFTMNALYARADGTVLDPLGGLPDLRARRVRFIDDAGARIGEDYLRILRLFRFHAWYGDPDQGLDPEALAAASELAEGLDTLSRERIGAEMRKLLAAPNPAPAVAAMAGTGVLARVLPGADITALAPLVHLEQATDTPPQAMRRLACLGGDDHQDRFRLSNADARDLARLRAGLGHTAGPEELAYRHGADAARDISLLNAAMLGVDLPCDLAHRLAMGASARFPVKPIDLMPEYQGAALGEHLRRLEDRWIASGFTLSRDALLGRGS